MKQGFFGSAASVLGSAAQVGTRNPRSSTGTVCPGARNVGSATGLAFVVALVQVIVLALVVTLLLGTPAFSCDCAVYKESIKKPDGIGAREGLEHMRSSEYRKEFAKAIADGYDACKRYAREHPDQSLAIVSDIDETLLDNSGHFKEDHKNFDWPTFKTWAEQSKAPPLKKTAAFLKWARKQGIAIFLVTGRPEEMRRATVRNLINADISYDGLFLRPSDQYDANGKHPSATQVKTKIREQIEGMGFTIVVNIGDQVSDLVGGHAYDCEKLPNKLYFVK
jgi:predicted secreted acid phosphatase